MWTRGCAVVMCSDSASIDVSSNLDTSIGPFSLLRHDLFWDLEDVRSWKSTIYNGIVCRYSACQVAIKKYLVYSLDISILLMEQDEFYSSIFWAFWVRTIDCVDVTSKWNRIFVLYLWESFRTPKLSLFSLVKFVWYKLHLHSKH